MVPLKIVRSRAVLKQNLINSAFPAILVLRTMSAFRKKSSPVLQSVGKCGAVILKVISNVTRRVFIWTSSQMLTRCTRCPGIPAMRWLRWVRLWRWSFLPGKNVPTFLCCFLILGMQRRMWPALSPYVRYCVVCVSVGIRRAFLYLIKLNYTYLARYLIPIDVLFYCI